MTRILDGSWNLRNQNGTISINLEIPCTVFEALIDNKCIKDPFYGNNEHTVKDIYNDNWEFQKVFDLKDQLLAYRHLTLKFEGLDTFAEIVFNGVFLGTTENMFRSYEFDIDKIVKKRNNVLRITFQSPVEKAKEFVDQYKIKLKTTHSMTGLPYIRKAQYSFGWDWGPNLPDSGIWKDIKIIGYEDVKIDSFYVDTKFTYNKSLKDLVIPEDYHRLNIDQVELTVYTQLSDEINRETLQDFELKGTITGPDEISYERLYDLTKAELAVQFMLEYPFVWWTHDLGKPNRYELNLSLYYKNEKIDSLQSKFGIRDVKLVQNPDKWGETFYFRLNGVPIFAKGANWVPIDSFIPRGKKLGLYEQNINNCVAANMNFIRVWGGGIYEDDYFYELCDEHGILVWQDFPFACAIYPIHEGFFENVGQEAIQNIIRLRNHPCLALWCGNNELEQLWKWLLINAELKEPSLIEKYEKGYLTLFKEIIPNLIKKYDPRHSYWPSSALDKYHDSKTLSSNPNNPESGDSHFWKVWHGGASFKSYRKFDSRFMSEFGFESFPSISTIKSFCPEDELYLDSPIMNNHQKNEDGNKKILRYIKRRFNIPETFKNLIFLSQITQAEAIQYGVEYWRQNRNDFHCMGTLYWQLNDCWPVISWSSFDYYGRWKALHYFARRFYVPLLPSIRENRNSIEMWITNDYASPHFVKYYWKLYNNQGKLLKKGFYEIEIPSCTSKCLEKVNLSDIKPDLEKQKTVLFYGIDGNDLTRGIQLFDSPKRFELRNPKISWDLEKLNANEKPLKCKFSIRTKNIGLYIFITSEKYDFVASDNFFSMAPEEERIIIINHVKPVGKENHQSKNVNKEDFRVYSLYDLMNH